MKIEDRLIELTNHWSLPYIIMSICIGIMILNPTDVQWERDWMRWVEIFNG